MRFAELLESKTIHSILLIFFFFSFSSVRCFAVAPNYMTFAPITFFICAKNDRTFAPISDMTIAPVATKSGRI